MKEEKNGKEYSEVHLNAENESKKQPCNDCEIFDDPTQIFVLLP